MYGDLFIGGGYLAAEFFALSSLIGAGALLTITTINWVAKRRVFVGGRRLTRWSGMSLFAGLLVVVCLRLSDRFDPQDQSFIFGLRSTTIELLLVLAFIVVFVSITVRVISQQYIP